MIGHILKSLVRINTNMNTIKSAFVELTGENGFPDKVTTDYHAIDGTKVCVRLQNTE